MTFSFPVGSKNFCKVLSVSWEVFVLHGYDWIHWVVSCTTTAYRWLFRDSHPSLRTLWSVIKWPKILCTRYEFPSTSSARSLCNIGPLADLVILSFGKGVYILRLSDTIFCGSKDDPWEELACKSLCSGTLSSTRFSRNSCNHSDKSDCNGSLRAYSWFINVLGVGISSGSCNGVHRACLSSLSRRVVSFRRKNWKRCRNRILKQTWSLMQRGMRVITGVIWRKKNNCVSSRRDWDIEKVPLSNSDQRVKLCVDLRHFVAWDAWSSGLDARRGSFPTTWDFEMNGTEKDKSYICILRYFCWTQLLLKMSVTRRFSRPRTKQCGRAEKKHRRERNVRLTSVSAKWWLKRTWRRFRSSELTFRGRSGRRLSK